MWSQLGGTFPAPLFLFLAGLSCAIVTRKLVQKGVAANQIAKTTIRRGAQIFALGLLFRVQEFAISLGWAPWSDLFRVDILNTIGVSIMLIGVMGWGVLALGDAQHRNPLSRREDARRLLWLLGAAVVLAAIIAGVTPWLWTTARPRFLPWQLETYINGVHNLGKPQPWLFPIFPWAAFAFAGLAFGFLLLSERAKRLGAWFVVMAAAAGVALVYVAKFLDSHSLRLYPVYDFWHTSPNFFLIRVGLLLGLVWIAYAWCRWGWGQFGFSPLIQMGNTSLLVYWVHIEFVYGRFSILPRRSQSVLGASKGLLIIFLSMLVLSLLRTKFKTDGTRRFGLRQRMSRAAKAVWFWDGSQRGGCSQLYPPKTGNS